MKNAFVVIPKEPDSEVIKILYGPWLSVGAHASRVAAYRELVAHMLKWEGREFAEPITSNPGWDGRKS